jgi:heme A synthase
MATPAAVRWLVGALLIIAATLFVIGTAVERNNDAHQYETALATTVSEGIAPAEGSEAEAAESAATVQPADNHTEAGESTNEQVLGINLESTPLVAIAVIVSLALAVATWRSDSKLAWLITAAFAAVFAIVDIAEFIHQLDRSKAGLAVLAALIAIIHAGAALLATQRGTADTPATA